MLLSSPYSRDVVHCDLQRLEERGPTEIAVLIVESGVGVNEKEIEVALERLEKDAYLLVVPYIVLIREEDHVASARLHRLGKVRDQPERRGIFEDHDVKVDEIPGHRSNDLERAVARSIIGDHDLVHGPGLSQHRLELSRTKAAPL